MTAVHVNLGDRSYDIAITSGDPAGVGPFARARGKGSLAFVVADENTRPHAGAVSAALTGAGFRAQQHILPPGEEQKCLSSARALYDALAEVRADRKTLVVPVGGGVVGDLAGFVAATYNR